MPLAEQQLDPYGIDEYHQKKGKTPSCNDQRTA